jgi:thiol-disulfide isomerase/thioredoxin
MFERKKNYPTERQPHGLAAGLTVALLILTAMLSPNSTAAQTTDGKESAALASTVISLRDIDCQSCGMEAVEALEEASGVESASFDRDAAELTVLYQTVATAPERLAEVVRGLGHDAVVGAGKGRYLEDVVFPHHLDVAWASRNGEKVNLKEYLADDKVTVFDFYATWCGPCREVDQTMLAFMQSHDNVALRKINVDDWGSPVAKQHLSKVPGLPYVVVYSNTGRKVEAISGLEPERLERALLRGGARKTGKSNE